MKPYLVLAAATVVGCGPRASGKPREETRASPGKEDAAQSSPPPQGPPRTVVIDAADPRAPCVFGYRGAVLDLGDKGRAADLGMKLRAPSVEWIEREGTSWAEVRGKSLSVDFFLVLPADVTAEGPAGATPFVEARVRGGAARTLSFYLNGHALGATSVARGETRIVALRGPATQPAPGANELTIRFSGISKAASGDPVADLEWVHFGVGDPDMMYAAPTRADTIVSRSFAGQPGRALSLRGPGSARCEGWLPGGSFVETRATLEGSGAADAEVRVVRDRVPATVIGTLHLDSADAPSGRVRSWPVGDVGPQGTLGAVELSVVRATHGARVIFGEPRVVTPVATGSALAPRSMPQKANGVVMIVLSQVDAHSLSVYGGPLLTPTIASLASSGVVFDAHRASTGIASGAVGAMLTGVSPRDLGVVDGDSRLPRGVTTLADAVRQAGITSAVFTANPLTSAAFGFDRGWSYFQAYSPTDDGPATRVFDAASAWLGEHHGAPFLLVIHSRGGHPPWDVPLDRARALPPENYTGGLDGRHAGELLGRSFKTPGSYRFEDADRARAGALYAAAMAAEDEGVGRLLGALVAAGVDESTTIVLTSDVGINDTARIPFAEAESLDEGALATPLIIRWAHEGPRGARVASASSDEDVATTILAAFGLPAPVTFRGLELHAIAADDGTSRINRALLAVDQDRFALRWGSFVTSGSREHETKLCDLALEAACVTDVRESYPLASRLLHAALFDRLVNTRVSFAREPATPDATTLAALKLWGR